MYEEDFDVAGELRYIMGNQFNHPGYYPNTSQDAEVCYSENYGRGGNLGTNFCSVENDEIFAFDLEKQLFLLDFPEARSSHVDDQFMQPSILTQDWMDPSVGNYSYENGQNQEGDDMEPSNSSSSSNCYWGGEIPKEPTDDYSDLDGEVGKRLNNMLPIRHVPRINGEIPSFDEATSDHQRLLDRLHLYDLIELKVQGDGNCQFRALSDQLYRSTEHHMFVRQQVVDQLKSNRNTYESYVPMDYDDYLKKLSKCGEWGDHVTLQAAADSYGVKIFVITSFKDTCYIEIFPDVRKSKRVIFLSFWAEVHYNSIYPEGDLPDQDMKRKKRWWNRKSD